MSSVQEQKDCFNFAIQWILVVPKFRMFAFLAPKYVTISNQIILLRVSLVLTHSFFHFQTEHHARSIVGIIEAHHCTLCNDKCCKYDVIHACVQVCMHLCIYLYAYIYICCLLIYIIYGIYNYIYKRVAYMQLFMHR